MQIKCEYCDHYIDEWDLECPHCGAPNEHAKRSASGVPQTIEELKEFAQKKNLPLEKMRFFIGEDCREPRAFGIYREPDGDIIVYKNKSDGTRVTRYRGTDEAYGVNELYQKMRSEVQLRKNKAATPPSKKTNFKLNIGGMIILIYLLVMILFLILEIVMMLNDNNGYYRYANHYYYNSSGNWYRYDNDDWQPVPSVDAELSDNLDDYYEGKHYQSDYGVSDFEDSPYHIVTDDDDWADDWDDDDWDWDSGSDWDSSDTDWDSDW